mmetsp:Transcript_19582/g.52826  ORF Transcript_19582/g.52826 Transcript_19582/m.52826 type:complete len:293 (+) Transcript_19582:420-1298(+)
MECRCSYSMCPLSHLLLGLKHAVAHEPIRESAVHALERDAISQRLPPGPRLGDDNPRVPDTHPDGMAPARNGLLGPVVRSHVVQNPSTLHEASILLDGDEVGVGPLTVEEVEGVALLGSKFGGRFALAPGSKDHGAPRLEDARHLFHILLLVGHVLSRLDGPHEVEGVVREVHLERVLELKLGIGHVLVLSKLRGALHLLVGDRDARDGGAGELLCKIARRATDAAAHIQNGLHVRARAGPLELLVNEVVFCLDEVLLLIACSALRVGVVAEVDVLTPIVLKDTILGPRVVL